MRPLIVTSGEPAGIGPDICVSIGDLSPFVVVAGDQRVLAQRAQLLGKNIDFVSYKQGYIPKAGELMVWDFPCQNAVQPGLLDANNAPSVLKMLTAACDACLSGEFSGLVTAPVHKAQLQQVQADFFGHTEFFQKRCQSPQVVMMLANPQLRVALVTTHLPLRQVADAISEEKIISVVSTVNTALKLEFAISKPKLAISGLNPHAGENGTLGHEENAIIIPAIQKLQHQGVDISGPFPADTMYLEKNIDAFIAMYHDQGLAVIKYASFGLAVNVSLGLPIVRTSVDHGTALSIAGRGLADSGSLRAAIEMAKMMVERRCK